MKSKIITKKKFLKINNKISQNLFKNKNYFKLYKVFLEKALKKRVAHQTLWFGEPILQLPQDLIIHQELIFQTKPDMQLTLQMSEPICEFCFISGEGYQVNTVLRRPWPIPAIELIAM